MQPLPCLPNQARELVFSSRNRVLPFHFYLRRGTSTQVYMSFGHSLRSRRRNILSSWGQKAFQQQFDKSRELKKFRYFNSSGQCLTFHPISFPICFIAHFSRCGLIPPFGHPSLSKQKFDAGHLLGKSDPALTYLLHLPPSPPLAKWGERGPIEGLIGASQSTRNVVCLIRPIPTGWKRS